MNTRRIALLVVVGVSAIAASLFRFVRPTRSVSGVRDIIPPSVPTGLTAVELGVPTVVTDDFNRANGGLGGNWTTSSDLAAAGGGSLQIVSNAVVSSPTNNHFASYYSGAQSFANDQYAQVTITGAAGQGAGVIVRHQGTVRSRFYLLICTQIGTGTPTNVVYFRCDNGTLTQLGGIEGAVVNSGSLVKLQIVGNKLIGSIDGLLLPSRTDTTYPSGFPGIECFSAALDNFQAGEA